MLLDSIAQPVNVNTLNKTTIFYHGNCTDGFGAAWSAYNWFGEGRLIKYIPVHYRSKVPFEHIDSDTNVYVLDFCFDENTMLKLIDSCKHVTVFDHHISNESILKSLPTHKLDYVFKMKESGAMITWNKLLSNDEPPALIKYISDRDLWTNKLPHCEEVAAYISSFEHTFQNFNTLAEALEKDFGQCIYLGEAILDRQTVIVKQAAAKAKIISFKGYKVPIVNTTIHQSEIGNLLVRKFLNSPFSMTYLVREDGKVSWSFRSNKDGLNFDVAVFAESLGGGGHKNAAGFVSDIKFLEEVLKNG